MSILEARLVNIINENKSDVSSLQIKLKELEGVIRYQDEVICKLSEDNLILKSKLCTIENLIPTVISDDHRDKKHVDGSANLISVNVGSKFSVIVQSTESKVLVVILSTHAMMRNTWCHVPFCKSVAIVLRVLAVISLIAIAIRIFFHLPDRLTTSVLPLFFTTTDLHRSRKIHHAE